MSPLVERKLVTDNGRSPVIRFYWGYSSPLGDEDKFVIPLVSIKGDDYHQMKRDGVPLYDILKKVLIYGAAVLFKMARIIFIHFGLKKDSMKI